MIACRRYAQKLSKKDHEKDILDILGNSRLEVKTKICIVTAKQRLDRAAASGDALSPS